MKYRKKNQNANRQPQISSQMDKFTLKAKIWHTIPLDFPIFRSPSNGCNFAHTCRRVKNSGVPESTWSNSFISGVFWPNRSFYPTTRGVGFHGNSENLKSSIRSTPCMVFIRRTLSIEFTCPIVPGSRHRRFCFQTTWWDPSGSPIWVQSSLVIESNRFIHKAAVKDSQRETVSKGNVSDWLPVKAPFFEIIIRSFNFSKGIFLTK